MNDEATTITIPAPTEEEIRAAHLLQGIITGLKINIIIISFCIIASLIYIGLSYLI